MINSRIAVAGALFAIAGTATAGISVTPTLTSDYDFRGISQTQNDPAFQLGLTYAGDGGFYMGFWGSNVDFQAGGDPSQIEDFDRPSTEIDVFMGYAWGDADEGVGFDAGLIYYTYPNAGAGNFPEVYAGVSKGPIGLKAWYSHDFNGTGDSAYYVESNFTVPMSLGFSLLGHLGYSAGDYWKNDDSEYMDWSMGIGYDIKDVNISIKYADGSDLAERDPRNLGRFIFSISTTLGE